MLAFGLCLALFAYWMLLGYAALALLEDRMDRLRRLLLAPVLGVLVTCLPLFVLNIFGVPVGRVAVPLAVVLLVGATATLWRTRRRRRAIGDAGEIAPPVSPFDSTDASRTLQPRPPLWRQYLPFGVLLLVALVMTGRPMFLFGFDWVSFCNDDMANYCLGAHRVLDHGYFDQPTAEELVRGRDYVQQMWFLHAPGMHRPGSEMNLALVCALTRLTAPEVFMVVIMAMHVIQISALAAFLYQRPSDRAAAWAGAALLSLSAIASLGALYQLIAQVSGLAVAMLAATLLLRPVEEPASGTSGFAHYLKRGMLIGVAMAGLMVVYPEVLPFLGLTWLIYTTIAVYRGRQTLKPLLATLGVGTLVTVLLLNWYALPSLAYLLGQAGTGTRVEDVSRTLFPYYLMPSGLSNLWGFQALARLTTEPFQSLAILLGAALLGVVTAAAVVRTVRGDPNATFALVMLLVAPYLFSIRAGFGLYKLAMYAQPFFLGLLAVTWFAVVRRRELPGRLVRGAVTAGPLVVLAGLGLWTQYVYVRGSCGIGQTFNEILDASDSRVYNEFRELVRKNEARPKPPGEPPDVYLVDSYNLVLAKFQSIANRGREMAFPSNRFYYPGGYKYYPMPSGRRLLGDADVLMATYGEQFRWEGFWLREPNQTPQPVSPPAPAPADPTRDAAGGILGDTAGDGGGDGDAGNTFLFNNLAAEFADAAVQPNGAGNNVVIVATTGKQSPFNRRNIKAPDDKANFVAWRGAERHNHLLFVSSELGHPYFSGGRIKPNYAIYQLESEPLFFRGKTMAGVGRHMLFQVINPSTDPATGKARVRVVLEMTASYKADESNQLPPARVVGTGTRFARFPGLVGRGAARVVSDAIEPQYVGGQPYVHVDMGVNGTRFPEGRKGLMRLFGTDVAVDRRALVGFLRDVSLVSDEEYAAFKPPTQISTFTTTRNDLREYAELEFSGIYEDGWVSESSFVCLRQPEGQASAAVVRGEVPVLPGTDASFETGVRLVVDGKVVAEQTLRTGRFELRGIAPPTTGVGANRRIELQFTQARNLPMVDGYLDGRPVSARLNYVGLQPHSDAALAAKARP